MPKTSKPVPKTKSQKGGSTSRRGVGESVHPLVDSLLKLLNIVFRERVSNPCLFLVWGIEVIMAFSTRLYLLCVD